MTRAKAPTYSSGEAIEPGDHITYHGERGKVELVALPEDQNTMWYIEHHGTGCMLLVPSFGRVFVTETDADEDLAFLARGEPPKLP
jgi:hypothetical protein